MVALAMPRKSPQPPKSKDQVDIDLRETTLWRDRPRDEVIEIGSRLERIRDSRSWEKTHPSFRAFTQDTWGLTESRVNQLIRAARLGKRLVEATGISPRTERLLRILSNSESGLDEQGQVEAWEYALKIAPHGNPTGAQLKGAVAFVRFKMESEGRETPEPTSNTGKHRAKIGARGTLNPRDVSQIEVGSQIERTGAEEQPEKVAATPPQVIKRRPGRPRKVRPEESKAPAPHASVVKEETTSAPQVNSDLEAILAGYSIVVNPKDFK